MRLRFVEGAKELIQANPELIINNVDNKMVNFRKLFDNNFPIHIEIGMGKGKFIYELAKNNPTINYVGIEKFDSAIVKALDKVLENPLKNLLLLRMDATYLKYLFEERSIDRIYLNFSDPWPKARHAKRRLTHQNFLKVYQKLMTINSEIHFKTDNTDLFNFSVEEIRNYPMRITYLTGDLHHSDFEGNITTEFEEKFIKQGNLIYKLTAKFKEA
jgi:tRNA (guanine-N7-)-methyltransferase